MDRRTRRELELQREWEGRHRFQELDSNESDDEPLRLRRRRVKGDKLHFTGFDLGTGQQGSDGGEWDEHSNLSNVTGRYDDRGNWQLARRDKEEDLIERALRRIRRAKLRGESKVNLSREELDALERDRIRGEPSPRPSPCTRPQGLLRQPNKKQATFDDLGEGTSKARRTTKRSSLPTQGSDQNTHPSASSRVPVGRSSSSPMKGPSYPGLTVPTRSISGGFRKPVSAPAYDLERDPSHYVSVEAGTYHRAPLLRNGNARALPDDPEWIPRMRSASSTSQLPYPDLHTPSNQPTYQSERRNFSGPAAITYSTARQIPQLPSPRGTGQSSPHVMNASDMHRSVSTLSHEVIEISSDEGNETDPSNMDEESDDGVRIDIETDDETGHTRARRFMGRR